MKLYGETGGVPANGVPGLEGCFIADRSGMDGTGAYIVGAFSRYELFMDAVVDDDGVDEEAVVVVIAGVRGVGERGLNDGHAISGPHHAGDAPASRGWL